MQIPGVDYSIRYNKKDITKDIASFISSITYTDNSEGESDDLQIQLDDSTNLWVNGWYPTKGDKISLRIGKMECGEFEIDELSSSGGAKAPSIFTIKALAVGITHPIRTQESYIHENKTIKEVITTICQANDYILDGSFDDIKFDRLVQNRQSSLHFMSSLAEKFGYVFNLRKETVLFKKQIEFETKPASYKIYKSMLESYQIRDKTEGTFSEAEVSYHNPSNNRVVKAKFIIQELPLFFDNTVGIRTDFLPDKLRVYEKAENQIQADEMAKTALYRANSKFRTAILEMKGNELYVSGLNLDLIGFGVLSGNYYITKSVHSINKPNGYKTTLELKHGKFAATETAQGNEE